MTDRFEDYLRGFEPAGLRRDLAATIGAARRRSAWTSPGVALAGGAFLATLLFLAVPWISQTPPMPAPDPSGGAAMLTKGTDPAASPEPPDTPLSGRPSDTWWALRHGLSETTNATAVASRPRERRPTRWIRGDHYWRAGSIKRILEELP